MNLWPKVKHLFDKDDGSLPNIFVEGISPDQTIAVYAWLMGQCEIAHDPTQSSIEKQQDIPIREVPDAARAFYQGRVESFRHGLIELSVRGVSLPELTVCLDSNGLSFDYRMGNKWNEKKVLALFELLRHVLRIAPRAQIKQADEGNYLHPNNEFTEAFKACVSEAED